MRCHANARLSPIVIGGLIAIEGVLALWLPLVAGSWSDRPRTPIGGRLPFLVAATPVACVSLAVTGLVGTLPLMAWATARPRRPASSAASRCSSFRRR